jgi:hypothetical protein
MASGLRDHLAAGAASVKILRERREEDVIMTPEQVEQRVIELIHKEPFVPFVVEMIDGVCLEIPHPRLAINGGGAGFIGPEGGLVDFEFSTVRAIRSLNAERVA